MVEGTLRSCDEGGGANENMEDSDVDDVEDCLRESKDCEELPDSDSSSFTKTMTGEVGEEGEQVAFDMVDVEWWHLLVTQDDDALMISTSDSKS